MEKITKYVLGFAFSSDRNKVVLIQKERPEWQKGKYNGVGGKVEGDLETFWPIHAMTREFEEETGVTLTEWQHFALMIFKNDVMGGVAVVDCFRIFDDAIFNVKTNETEVVSIFDVRDVRDLPSSNDNLDYLVSIALHEKVESVKITY